MEESSNDEEICLLVLGFIEKIKKDRATSLVAEQSYYNTFVIFPLMILILSIILYLSIYIPHTDH